MKQAPRAWYDRITAYLTEHGFKRGSADTTLFIRNDKNSLVVAQIYVDDVVFGATNDSLVHSFADEMKAMFEMSMVGELTYFFGITGKTNRLRNQHQPSKICKESSQEIWIGQCCTCQNTNSRKCKINK